MAGSHGCFFLHQGQVCVLSISIMKLYSLPLRLLMLTLIAQGVSLAAVPLPAPKRVIVCTYTAGFRHSSIPDGEKAVAEIAETTKAFVIVGWVRSVGGKASRKSAPPPAEPGKTNRDELIRQEFEKLSPAYLAANKIDGVIFVNTSGDLPLPDVEGFVKWIEAGGAFIGMHAASDTLKKSRPYMDMLQGCFAGHGPQVPAKLIAGDTDHPANGKIGAEWSLPQEEIYHINKQDRTQVRALWFMRHDPNNVNKTGFFPISWARQAGTGRVFYTALGHREDLWSADSQLRGRINPVETSLQYRAHIQGGILWALGLADGSAIPNPELK